jgi:hypothetical protein
MDRNLSTIPHLKHRIDSAYRTSKYITRLLTYGHRGPPFPVIQQLVKSIIIPKLTYGLPFVTLGDFLTCRIAFKKVLIYPLRRSLALPHSAHHHSLFLESRLLSPIPLYRHNALAFAHRLFSIQPNVPHQEPANMAVSLLLKDLTNVNHLPRHHPIHAIHSSMQKYPEFTTTPLLLQTPRYKIRKVIFDKSYTKWYGSPASRRNDARSLHPYYPSPSPPSLQLPLYLLNDDPDTAICRSRLRFGRTMLGFHANRLQYPNTSKFCAVCPGSIENIEHVFCSCPAYNQIRAPLVQALAPRNIPITASLLLDYPTDPDQSLDNRKAFHLITSTFLTNLSQLRLHTNRVNPV